MLNLIRHFLYRFVRPPEFSEEQLEEATRTLIGECPACSNQILGHRYIPLASAFSDQDSPSLNNLRRLISDRDWAAAKQIREWDPKRDVEQYFVVECPIDNSVWIKQVISTSDLHGWDGPINTIPLNKQEQDSIRETLTADWKRA